MTITEQELRTLISFNADIEKISTLSSDGKNLLTRIPKKVKDALGLKKSYQLRWLVNREFIKIEVLKHD